MATRLKLVGVRFTTRLKLVGVRLTEKLAHDLRVYAVKRGQTIQEVAERAIASVVWPDKR